MSSFSNITYGASSPNAICSNCSALLNISSMFCQNCGQKVTDPQTVAGVSSIPAAQVGSACINCGGLLKPEVEFCGCCGQQVVSAVPSLPVTNVLPSPVVPSAYTSPLPISTVSQTVKTSGNSFKKKFIVTFAAVIGCIALAVGVLWLTDVLPDFFPRSAIEDLPTSDSAFAPGTEPADEAAPTPDTAPADEPAAAPAPDTAPAMVSVPHVVGVWETADFPGWATRYVLEPDGTGRSYELNTQTLDAWPTYGLVWSVADSGEVRVKRVGRVEVSPFTIFNNRLNFWGIEFTRVQYGTGENPLTGIWEHSHWWEEDEWFSIVLYFDASGSGEYVEQWIYADWTERVVSSFSWHTSGSNVHLLHYDREPLVFSHENGVDFLRGRATDTVFTRISSFSGAEPFLGAWESTRYWEHGGGRTIQVLEISAGGTVSVTHHLEDFYWGSSFWTEIMLWQANEDVVNIFPAYFLHYSSYVVHMGSQLSGTTRWGDGIVLFRQEVARDLQAQLMQDYMRTGLGLHLTTVWQGLEWESEGVGVHIDYIMWGSDAARAGMMVGDIIVNIDGLSIYHEWEVRDIIEWNHQNQPGDWVGIQVLRDGEHHWFEMRLGHFDFWGNFNPPN